MESIFLLPKTKGVFDMELKAIQLTKQYGSKTAVNHLNLSLSNGVYGLLGANGAGKTTLMRLLCDIQTPTSGKITLDGKNISVLGEKYRNLLGYLPQQFGYYPDFTAWDFLMYVAALKGLSEKQAHKKATELLEAVDLAEKRNLKIKTFSGGMKQRLGIAQAMLNNPRILILDEPTAGLDPKERVSFRNLISAFSKDRIVILSTHIVSDVEFIAEDIIMMKDGQILHFGKTQEITTEIDGQVWECTVPTSRAEQYSETLNISNLRNIENNCTVLRVISEQSPMENAIKVEPTLENGRLIQEGYKTSYYLDKILNYSMFERKIRYSEEMITSREYLDKKSALDYIIDALQFILSVQDSEKVILKYKLAAKSVNEDENSKVYAVVKAEIEEIMKISNEYFDIRHNEYLNKAKQAREPIQDLAFIEYLYNRAYALLYLLRIKTDTDKLINFKKDCDNHTSVDQDV